MPPRFLASVLPAHESAELYRLMVEGIRESAVFLMDPHGYITVWNKAAEEMKGYTADEAIGQHLRLLYTEEDRARCHPEHNLRVAAEEGFFTEETWRRRKDGSRFWAHISLTGLRSPETKELLGFSKITLDLTRHRLLEECEHEKQETQLVMHAAQAGTWKWHLEADTVDASPQLLELLGYPGTYKSVETFEQWLGHVHEDDRASLRERLLAIREKPELAPLETEMRLLRQEGEPLWIFLRANWHGGGDKSHPLALMGACVAIDNIKKTEGERERLYQALEFERTRLNEILEQMPSGIVMAEAPSGKLVYQNRRAEQMLERGVEEIESISDYDKYPCIDADGVQIAPEDMPLAQTVRRQEASRTQELIYRRRDGSHAHFAITTASVWDADGISRLAVAVLHDISALKQAQLQAASEKERALVTLAAITDGVVTTDPAGVVRSMNPAAERLLNLSEAAARDKRIEQLVPGANGEMLAHAVRRSLDEERVIGDLPHLTLHGSQGTLYAVENAVAPVRVEGGDLIGAVLVFHDVTESRRLMRRLGFEASHDALTGLVNRREFELRLGRTLERTRHAPGTDAALLYMDLDQFKIINDTCGHAAGDELLKRLAHTYLEHVRERDTLARIGGDEFALIVEHCQMEEALAVAHKILEATRNFRYSCKGRVFQLGVSIGLTPIDQQTPTIEEALRRADHACYIAKDRGRNRIYVHYKGELDFIQRRNDMHWVTRLTHAFQNEQLQLYCQPIRALSGADGPAHLEILLRLRNGRGAPIGPHSFLPAAERYDVILKIDRWVLRQTLDWLANNPDEAGRIDMCSINLSRRSLADQSFHTYAAGLIDESKVPASKLCFEITENGAIADMQKTIAFIQALSARGCRFSLDDFGSGMTSFSYLKQLPVDFIKIDGAFIQMMQSNEVDFEMVRFTNDISHKMGRKTIAEYVTDQAIHDRLQEIGVDFAQGFYVGKPRPLTA
jgi:diguanylate cyclase (GGDEF)-like protein/PAS domain S-box-containing protein